MLRLNTLGIVVLLTLTVVIILGTLGALAFIIKSFLTKFHQEDDE